MSRLALGAAGTITSRARGAWLLRAIRLDGKCQEYRNLTRFSKALETAGIGRSGPSTISRIETGVIGATFEVVRGYEVVLGLPAYSIVSVLDTNFRYRASTFDAKPLLTRHRQDGRSAYYRFDELMERADSRGVMTGAEWDELTVIVTERPDLVVSPRRRWLDITNRLLTEVMIADGIVWMQKYEAINRLLAHPTLGADALSTLRATVDDRTVQSLVGTVALFDASAEPSAAAEVLRHLSEPADDRVLKGALMACVRKLRYQHFTGSQLKEISRLVATTLLEPSYLDDGTRTLAISVLRQLPPQSHTIIGRNLLLRTAKERSLISVLEENRILGWAAGRIAAQRIADYAIARTPTVSGAHADYMLPILIDEILFDPVFDVRHYAASLIYASPYRPATAEALADEVMAARRSGNQAWLTTVFEALRSLGGQRERNMVEQFVIAPGVPGAVADVAAFALGHIGGTSTDGFWQHALVLHRRAWERSASQVNVSILDKLVYAIGMSHATRMLVAIRSDARMPPKVQSSAAWWLDRPSVVLRSARC